jgi:hypothetical protein
MESAASTTRYAEADPSINGERRYEMTTISHGPSNIVREKPRWREFLVAEMWASLAIVVMWLAVLFDAIFGPDILSSTPGGSSSTVPSAVAVALFAFLGTWVVARHAFGRKPEN